MDAHEKEYEAAANASNDNEGRKIERADFKPGDVVEIRLSDWNYSKTAKVSRVTNTGAIAVILPGGERHIVWPSDVEG